MAYWITAALWIVAPAVHLGYDALVAGHGRDNVGAATIVLYLAVSLAIQRVIVRLRAQRLGGPAGGGNLMIDDIPATRGRESGRAA